jgi:Fur family ferric uptake transcriptional regulator
MCRLLSTIELFNSHMLTMEAERDLLRRNNIVITKTRLLMIKDFLRSTIPLTRNNFYRNPNPELDRTTIFRTLELFLQKGVITRIPSTDGIKRYLLRELTVAVESNFVCSHCKKIIPVRAVLPPEICLPAGYKGKKVRVTIEGICDSCEANKKKSLP